LFIIDENNRKYVNPIFVDFASLIDPFKERSISDLSRDGAFTGNDFDHSIKDYLYQIQQAFDSNIKEAE
jgi:uridine kinase